MPRKKKPFNMQAACLDIAGQALGKLKEIALCESRYKPSVKLAALREIMDRAYGKPKETIDDKRQPRIIEIIHAASAVQDDQVFKAVQDSAADDLTARVPVIKGEVTKGTTVKRAEVAN